MSKNNFNRRGIAALAATALCGLSMAGMASTAFAQTDVPPNLIDDTRATTLTINKYLGAPIAGPSDGTEITEGVDLPALSGVAFDVYLVEGVDLTTNDGWAAATALENYTLTQDDITAGSITLDGVTYGLTLADTVTTVNGSITYTGGVGLYLVNENLADSGEITGPDGVVPTNSITPSKPFLVTLPMTQPNDLNAWMYDVHVYPKNAADTVTKTVEDMGTVTSNHDGAGAVKAFEYQIATSVTPGLTAAEIETYVIGDTIDPRLALTSVEVDGMTLGEDFVVYVNDTIWDGTAIPAGQPKKVEVVLTTAGIEKAITADGALTRIGVEAGAADDDGVTEFLNDAQFVPNAGWWEAQTGSTTPYDPGTDDPDSDNGDPVDPPTSDEVRTLYGALDLTKVDAADNGILLEDAEFAVYRDVVEADASAVCSIDDIVDANLISGGHATDATGFVRINGLQTSNFYDNAVQEDTQTYCLVETKAAEGYNLLAEPIAFTITHTIDPDTGIATANVDALTVENVKTNLDNDLPLTGGQGAAMLGGRGILALGGAGGYLAYRSRQEKAAQVKA